MSSIAIDLTDQDIAQLSDAASALTDGIIEGLKEFGNLSTVTDSTFSRLSASTSLVGIVAQAIQSGQYTKAFLQGLFGSELAAAAVYLLPLVVANPGADAGVAAAAAFSYLGSQLGGWVYEYGSNIDMTALGNSLVQALNATLSISGLSANNVAPVLLQNVISFLVTSPNANLPAGSDLISSLQQSQTTLVQNMNQQITAAESSPQATTTFTLTQGTMGTFSFTSTSTSNGATTVTQFAAPLSPSGSIAMSQAFMAGSGTSFTYQLANGASVTLTGVNGLSTDGAVIKFTDFAGNQYTISPGTDLNSVEITNLSGNQSLQLNLLAILGSSTTNQVNVAIGGSSNGAITATFLAADNNTPLQIAVANGQVSYSSGSSATTLAGSNADFSGTTLDGFSSTNGATYLLNQSGAITGVTAGYDTSTITLNEDSSNISTAASNASQLESNINTATGLFSATGPSNDAWVTTSVEPLLQSTEPSDGTGADGTPFTSNANDIFASGGATIAATGQGSTALAGLTSSSIASGDEQPFNQDLLGNFSNVPVATSVLNSPLPPITLPTAPGSEPVSVQIPVTDVPPAAVDTNPTPSYTDPLLLDLTGGGINVSNWITSPVYFDTNVLSNASGNPTTTPDGMEHETAWMAPGTAMLVFESGGTIAPITNITQTVSQFLNAGPTPAQYADGLAALAALVQIDPTTGKPYTVFSAQTAAIDPITKVSYWDEVMVWNDANQIRRQRPGRDR